MTMLARDACLLGLTVDTWKIYTQDDPYYELWLSELVDLTNMTLRERKAQK